MSEEDWLGGWDYRRMYGVVRKQTTPRLARLFAVATCRLKAAEFFDDRIQPAVDAAESWADDLQAEASAGAVWFELATTGWPQTTPRAPTGEIAEIIKGVWRLLDEYWRGVRYIDARHAIAHAVYLCLRSNPEVILTGGAGNAAEYCAWAIDCAASLQAGGSLNEFEEAELGEETPIRRAIAHLLRDLYGNPFRPACVEPSLRTPTVLSIAQAVYEVVASETCPSLLTPWKMPAALPLKSSATCVGRARTSAAAGSSISFSASRETERGVLRRHTKPPMAAPFRS